MNTANRTCANGKYQLKEFVPLPGSQVRAVVPKKNKKNGTCPGVQKTATVPDAPAVP